jgi:hypothetical protein
MDANQPQQRQPDRMDLHRIDLHERQAERAAETRKLNKLKARLRVMLSQPRLARAS